MKKIDNGSKIELLKALKELDFEKKYLEVINEDKPTLKIPFNKLTQLISDQEIQKSITEQPSEFREILNNTINTEMTKKYLSINKNIQITYIDLPKQIIHISNIRSEQINKLITTQGLIKKISPVFTTIAEKTYRCGICTSEITQKIQETEQKPPFCRECKKTMKEKSQKAKDIMTIEIIEENYENSKVGQMNSITITLEEPLTQQKQISQIRVGDKATIIGKLKVKDEKKKMQGYLIEAFGITTERTEDNIQITKQEEEQIRAIPKQIEHWSKQLFTTIYGMQDIKETIICSLIGLSTTKLTSQNTRGNFHIGLFGDPSIAKSTILLMAKNYSIKGRYTSGTGASGVGLTASVIFDDYTKTWTAEAGTMVLADEGHAFIDEIEKMSEEDHNKLHEGLEQQQITISKAGLTLTLPCRTTLICAGNPKAGEIKDDDQPSKALGLSPAFQSRIDMKWMIQLDYGENFKHVLDKSISNVSGTTNKGKEEPIELFKKYILIARQKEPTLPNQIHDEIREYILEIVKKAQKKGIKPPITPRSSQTLTRLTMIHAKAELKTEVEKEDFEWAKKVYANSLKTFKIDIDDPSNYTQEDLENDKAPNERQIGQMINIFIEEKINNNEYNFSYEEIKNLFDKKISLDLIETVFEKIREKKYIIKSKDLEDKYTIPKN